MYKFVSFIELLTAKFLEITQVRETHSTYLLRVAVTARTSHSIAVLYGGREGREVVFGINVLSQDSTHPIWRRRKKNSHFTLDSRHMKGGDRRARVRSHVRATTTRRRQPRQFTKRTAPSWEEPRLEERERER